ncbi:MAG TPA: HEAT repeat domain-containing protein [Actinomycetales bacterium]|nr:HEAT repeat domain-containing protein [Actinomycetales bacterium]
MSANAALGVALLALGVVLFMLAGVVVAGRAHRQRRERRRAALATPLRPLLLQLAAGEQDESVQALDQLLALDDRSWAALEPDVTDLLLKVRGETKASIVALLQRRGTLARALRETTSTSAVRRARGAEVLGAAGRRTALPELLPLLRDTDPEVRQVTARAMGRIRAPAAARPLLEALAGDRTIPPRIVATAVTGIGSAAYPALEASLRAEAELERAVAAEICGLTAAVPTVPALIRIVLDDPALEVRIRAARALGRIGAPIALRPLLLAVDDANPLPLRVVAAKALGELGSDEAVPGLARLAADPAHRLAANAAAALTRCGPKGLLALRAMVNQPDGAHAREALALSALRSGDHHELEALRR